MKKCDKDKLYYHFEDDLLKYDNAWCYVVWSARGKGKTYSALKYAYENHIPIIYMKRTIEDIGLICSANNYGFDPSPYVPINRDCNYNVRARAIDNGIAGFWNFVDNEPSGLPVSYCLAMSAVRKFKGFDFSNCDWIIFDEFIPQLGERISRKEGELLLDLYMTIARDRQKRGKKPLKLILFANAEEISTPITNTLEIVDIMADLNASGVTHFYDDGRDILLHHITSSEFPLLDEEKTGIYEAMKNTAWGAKSFEGSFANNDFSNVSKESIKGCVPFIHLHVNMKDYYIYLHKNTGVYYMCESRGKCLFEYDLNKENGQKKFWLEHQADLRNACIDGNMKFQKYSMYDLIMNYKKFYSIY